MGLAEDIVLIILAGLLFGFLAHVMRLPLILGYIVAGVSLGPLLHGADHAASLHEIELLAEIGVALLLFSVGLDFSFKKIRDLRRITLLGTVLQVGLSIAVVLGAGVALGYSWSVALVLGFIVSLSSTMIVLKSLLSQGLMGTLSSRIMIGMLIVQDLAAIPMMILIPQLQALEQGWLGLLLTLFKAVAFLVVLILLGTKLVPSILRMISRLHSPELFLLTITALSLGVGFLSFKMGLSFAFGAFVAGMVINESEYSHKALSDIMPLRDIFGLLFFTSIGLLFDAQFFWENLQSILLLLALVMTGKFLLFFGITRIFGYYNIVPLAAGLGLAQIGEFSFVLSRSALKSGILAKNMYDLVLATTILSLFISPFLMLLTPKLYALRRRFGRKQEELSCVNMPSQGLQDHILIAGAGRVGRTVAQTLQYLNYTFVLVEEDYQNFYLAKGLGYPVIYGDAAKENVLEAAGLQEARLLIVTIPSVLAASEIISIAKSTRKAMDIVVRSASIEASEELYAMQIYEVVQPEFEASMEMLRQALLHLDVPAIAIQDYIDQFRRKVATHTAVPDDEKEMLARLKNSSHLLEMKWERIVPDSLAAGRSLKELEIRSRTGASVVGVYRGQKFFLNPEADFVLRPDDLVALLGKTEHRILFHTIINRSRAEIS